MDKYIKCKTMYKSTHNPISIKKIHLHRKSIHTNATSYYSLVVNYG